MKTDPASMIAPDTDALLRMAEASIAALPAPYRDAAATIALRVADFAPDDMLAALDLPDPFELTGLYDGTPLTEKSVTDQPMQPDAIWLFRRAILDEWADRGDIALGDLVTHVLVHELAHHFGWTDAEIAAVDPWWE